MCGQDDAAAAATKAGRKRREYVIFNETDGVWAYPDTVTWRQAKQIIRKLKDRYKEQGYYAAVGGRIPVSMLSLKVIPLRPDGTPEW